MIVTCITEISNYVMSDSLLFGIIILSVLYLLQKRFDFYIFKVDIRDHATYPSQEQFKHIDTTHCIDGKCVRCHKYSSIRSTASMKVQSLIENKSFTKTFVNLKIMDAKTSETKMEQAIEKCRISLMNKIPSDSDTKDVDRNPNVYFHRSLTSRTFWNETDVSDDLQNDVKRLEECMYGILMEFKEIYTDRFIHHWKRNSTDSGSWDVFHLMNQGTWIEENARLCPWTTDIVQQLSSVMKENVFGNVLFSVIKPATLISPHYGPTNLRLRCHLGLVTNSECVLQVGSDLKTWSDGQCLVFDDSFLHSVEYRDKGRTLPKDSNAESESMIHFNGSLLEQGDRAVLIVDMWHPEVSDVERCVLSYLFSPDNIE